MKILTEIRKAVDADPHGDPTAIARTVLARCRKGDLVGLVAEEVKAAQRATARSSEREAFRETFTRTPRSSGATSDPALESLRPLFATPFRIGDGGKVQWLKATVEQHQERIAMLSKMRDGIDSTIDRHREAVALIESAGVTCLADLGAVVAEAA